MNYTPINPDPKYPATYIPIAEYLRNVGLPFTFIKPMEK